MLLYARNVNLFNQFWKIFLKFWKICNANIFRGLHQFTLEINFDLTKQEILDAAQQSVVELDSGQVYTSFVTFHGDKDYLMSNDDEEINLKEDILEKFSNKNCWNMKDRPNISL